ncbi:hypothetical protein QML44_30500, partial [Klebsiella pneumoniae]
PKVETHGKKFVKTNEQGDRLAGAQFVVKNSAGKYLALKADQSEGQKTLAAKKIALDEAIAAYNKLSATDQKGEEGITAKELIKTKQADYDAAFIEARTAYEWITDKARAITYTSNDQGQFEVTGLADGTY